MRPGMRCARGLGLVFAVGCGPARPDPLATVGDVGGESQAMRLSEKRSTHDPGAAVWARVQAVLATADRDAQAASQTLQQMLAETDPGAGADARLVRALVLRGVARLDMLFRGRAAEAIAPAQEAVALLASLEDAPMLCERRVGGYGDLSNALEGAGRREEAIAAAQSGLAVARGCSDKMTVIRALVRIGGQLAAIGRRDEADANHAEALALARAMDNPEAKGLAELGLGLRAIERGAIDAAVEHLEAAYREFGTSGNVGDQRAVLQALTGPAVIRSRPEVAREAARKAEALQTPRR